MEIQTRHPIAFLTDLTVHEDGQYVKTDKTLDENLLALDNAIKTHGSTAETALQPTDLDGTTLEKDETNGVRIKDGAVTTEKLANLASINMTDAETGAVYKLQIVGGRLEIVGSAE